MKALDASILARCSQRLLAVMSNPQNEPSSSRPTNAVRLGVLINSISQSDKPRTAEFGLLKRTAAIVNDHEFTSGNNSATIGRSKLGSRTEI